METPQTIRRAGAAGRARDGAVAAKEASIAHALSCGGARAVAMAGGGRVAVHAAVVRKVAGAAGAHASGVVTGAVPGAVVGALLCV